MRWIMLWWAALRLWWASRRCRRIGHAWGAAGRAKGLHRCRRCGRIETVAGALLVAGAGQLRLPLGHDEL